MKRFSKVNLTFILTTILGFSVLVFLSPQAQAHNPEFLELIWNLATSPSPVTNSVTVTGKVQAYSLALACAFHPPEEFADPRHEWEKQRSGSPNDIDRLDYRVLDQNMIAKSGWNSLSIALDTDLISGAPFPPENAGCVEGTFIPYLRSLGFSFNPKLAKNGNLTEDGKKYFVEIRVSSENSATFFFGQVFFTMAPPLSSPDLIIASGPTLSDANPEAGQKITFSAAAKNQGDVKTGTGFDYDFILDRQSGWDIQTRPTNLGAGVTDSTRTSKQWTAQAGSHTIQVCADKPVSRIDELNELNNCSPEISFNVLSAPEQPDLVVASGPTLSDSTPQQGQSITFSAAAKNQGNAGTGGGFDYNFILDEQSGWSIVRRAANLGAGVTDSTRISKEWPATFGSHTIQVCADSPTSEITESQEFNNCGNKIRFDVSGLPDLVVTNITRNPDPTTEGDAVKFTTFYKNAGNASAGSFNVRWYLDSNAWVDVKRQGTSMEPGEPSQRTSDRSWPATAGTHTIKSCLDEENEVAESDESTASNCRTETLIITATQTPTPTITPTPTPGSTPSASNVKVTEPNYCSSGPAATTSWDYSEPSGLLQSAYQVQIDEEGESFKAPEWDSGKIFCSSCRANSTPQGFLEFNTTYQARVRVWNSNDAVSNWTGMILCEGPGCNQNQRSWKTPPHAYPQVNFTWSPSNPAINQLIQFLDQTRFFDSTSTRRAWSWLFGDGGSSTSQNPTHAYTAASSYNVTLTATDSSGFSCNLTKPLLIQTGIPIWKEINPGDL